MIRDLFAASQPVFIALRDTHFVIGHTAYSWLHAQIHSLTPIRKLFLKRQLACYSLNNKTGKNGQYCALCPDRFRCQPRLRLMLLIHAASPNLPFPKEPLPAILEINAHSFPALDALIAQIGQKNLPATLVQLKIVYTDLDYLAIEFSPVS